MTLVAGTGLIGSPTTTSETPGWVGFDRGIITEIGSGGAPRGAEDLGDVILVPGFVDVQINGLDDIDFGACDALDAVEALERITSSGCTTCLPTLVTAPDSRYGPMLDAIAGTRHVAGAARRAQAAGVHLEGPFLGGAPGAHPRSLVRNADLDALATWVQRHRDLVRLVTLAPEADPGFAATTWLVARGVTVAIGHTDADFDWVVDAFRAGASVATHLFNGMGRFHHREPGPAGAALATAAVTASLIADGTHVHPAAALMAIAAKERVALVTDAVAVDAGRAGGVDLVAGPDGTPQLADGTLAGSVLTMDAAVRNVVRWGVPIERAVAMATTIPAAAVGLHDRARLEPGLRGDMVALDRSTLAVVAVWIAGERVR